MSICPEQQRVGELRILDADQDPKVGRIDSGLLLLLSRTSAADPIHLFESGTPGPDGQPNGTPFGDFQFIGPRFFVPSTVTTETIGGHMGGLSGVDVFGAIVALSGSADFPDSRNLSTPDVLGASRIVLSPSGGPSRSQLFSVPLDVRLSPGWYALVFGSGLFGATGSGMLTSDCDSGNARFRYLRGVNESGAIAWKPEGSTRALLRYRP